MEGWSEPQPGQSTPTNDSSRPSPTGRAASLGPLSAQGRVCQDSGLVCALRAKFVCRQEEELIRSPASMITWGVSCLLIEAEVEGDPVLKAQ